MSEIGVNAPKDFMNLGPIKINCVNSTPRYIAVHSDHNYATALAKNISFQVWVRLCSYLRNSAHLRGIHYAFGPTDLFRKEPPLDAVISEGRARKYGEKPTNYIQYFELYIIPVS